ncbi:MAG: hypothetical protein N2053_12995 [Chitinispirillaceae bacterium]|nr:hypothetical protein [Chitinispirillaceae bacterium]
MVKKIEHPQKNILFLSLLLFLISFSYAELDSTKTAFFNELNLSLHSEYMSCTSDSTPLSLDSLLRWKKHIDSITESPGYPVLLRKYSEETGISPALAKPCEVFKWMNNVKEDLHKASEMLAYEKEIRQRKKEDSLFLLGELKRVKNSSYDLLSIPFGLSKRSLLIMLRQKGLLVIDSCKFLYCDSVPLGVMNFKGYFYFSRNNNKYSSYELESTDCSSDSLDKWARAMMDYLAAYIETKTGKPPDHIYRISRFDIVAGRLTTCKMWNFSDATILSGLSRRKNRFYAKLVVSWKELR